MEKVFLPRDVRASEIKSKQDRIRSNKTSHVENLLYGELKKRGEINIKIVSTDMEKKEVVAIFSGKKATFQFDRNHLGNFYFHHMENSFDDSIVAEEKKPIDVVNLDNDITFDMAHFIAHKIGADAYEIHYASTGPLGIVAKVDLTMDSIKTLAAMKATKKGLVPKFVGEFKLAMVDTREDIENLVIENVPFTEDKYSKAVGDHYAKVKDGKFDMDPTKSLRANTIKRLEIEAQNIIKNSATYSTGVIKVLSTNSVVEYDKAFKGHILVKAKVRDKVICYVLPVEGSRIKLVKKLNEYVESEKDFYNRIEEAEEKKIKDQYITDINVIALKEQDDAEVMTALAKKMKIEGFRDIDIQTSMEIPKTHFSEDLKIGNKINLQGITYEIQENKSPALYTLVRIK